MATERAPIHLDRTDVSLSSRGFAADESILTFLRSSITRSSLETRRATKTSIRRCIVKSRLGARSLLAVAVAAAVAVSSALGVATRVFLEPSTRVAAGAHMRPANDAIQNPGMPAPRRLTRS